MSDSNSTGFGKFVPGFDFLQNLAKGAGAGIPQMPNLGAWVAPSLSVEDLEKRIEELKNVLFWLEQNSRALSATIQALEVQKLTLATLKGMNVNIAEMANAFTPKPAAPARQAAPEPEEVPQPEPEDDDSAAEHATEDAGTGKGPEEAAPAKPLIDPLQLWGSLTQQFQTIAASALKEATAATAANMSKNMAAGRAAASAAKKAVAKRSPAKKAAGPKASTQQAAASKAASKSPAKTAAKTVAKTSAKASPPAKGKSASKPAAKRAAPAKAPARKPAGR